MKSNQGERVRRTSSQLLRQLFLHSIGLPQHSQIFEGRLDLVYFLSFPPDSPLPRPRAITAVDEIPLLVAGISALFLSRSNESREKYSIIVQNHLIIQIDLCLDRFLTLTPST
jgi:hypothetical protein